jgi:CheY-like chemotaxis protein
MISTKAGSIKKFNELFNAALKPSTEFPDQLAEFLVNEFALTAVIIFDAENNKLKVTGKSSKAKYIYHKQDIFECPSCLSLNSKAENIIYDSHSPCKVPVTDFMMPESSVYIKSPAGSSLIKIARETVFTENDKDEFIEIGAAAGNLIGLWKKSNDKKETHVSEVITKIAHDLRTPLNSIIGFASLLSEENVTPLQAEYVSTLKESSLNMLSLLNDLIDIARLEEGKTDSTFSIINLKKLINDIVSSLSEQIDKKAINFIISFDESIPANIKTSREKLHYILNHLLTFSLRLMEKGKISIQVSQSGPAKINFRISDTSTGLSSAKMKDIFSPAIISELGNKNIGNISGLGLILTKRYIEFLKGNLDVTSAVGKGITYNFSVEAEIPSAIEAQIGNLPSPGKRNNVLVVEDDYATSKLLGNYLVKWGYEPVIVNSGKQALKELDKNVFLAVLMDIILPDINGFELLKTIREHKNTKNTPVIVCSVEAEQQKAFLMGAVEYFVKPINYNFLVEVLTSYRLQKDSNILIVDDDVPTLNLMREAVLQLGFNPVAESHSSKVNKLINDMSLDLAIIDLDMPEVNGYELIKQIKSNPRFIKLPIIIYTGKENYKDELKKIDGLFEDLLEKNSSNIEDLAGTISSMINRYVEPSSPEDLMHKSGIVKILLVEDYKHSQIIVTRLLKKNNYENIVVVENGAEAIDEAKKQKYDLILMDMQMPVMNGFEATEKIRLIPGYKDTPIVALTAFAMKGDREKCLEAGATDYIPKPIDSIEFIEKVKYYTEIKVKSV